MPLTSVDTVINDDVSVSSVDDEDSDNEIVLKTRWRRLHELVTIEPMLLLQMIALSSCVVNVQNYYIDCICIQEFKNHTICSNLTAYSQEETHVERIASLYATYRGLIEAGLPILFSLFLGPWSDKHGSKIPMILPLCGYTVSTIMYTIFASMSNLNPQVLLIASVPIALTGGLIALIMSAFRYIADITTVENRSFRIAIAEGSWFLGAPLGLLGSTKILKYGGYQTVFFISTILYTLSLLYTIFFVKNDKPSIDPNSNSNMFKDMFNLDAVKDTVRTCFKKRHGNGRFWIIILLITICIRILSLSGGFSVTYLYTRNRFNWTNQEFSTYSTVDGILGIVGSGLAIVLLMKILKMSDAAIGLISSISCLGGTIVFMVAPDGAGWMMYLGGTVQMLSGLISVLIRSMLSKIVSKDELGKVFSFLATGEATMPLISAPLYNFVFIETVSSFPQAIYLLSTFLNGCIVLSFIYFFIAFKNMLAYSELDEDNTESRA